MMRSDPKRKVYVSLAAGVAAATITLILGYVLFLRNPAQPEAQAHKELLECLVCKRPVDPLTTQFKLTYHNQKIYFDRQECLDAFVAEPRRYGRVKIEARLDPNGSGSPQDESPGPSVSASSGEAEIGAPSSATPDVQFPTDASASPTDDMVTPVQDETGAPESTDTPPVDDSATRDPNPPPLHKDNSKSSDDAKTPAACSDDSSASPAPGGDDEVPQPPSGK